MLEGVVTNVIERLAGSELTNDAAAGASGITVLDPDEFEEDGGGLRIGDEEIVYSVCDPDTGLIVLKTPLAGSYAADEPVYVDPKHIERIAHMREHGAEEELEARVPHGLYERLPVGTRDTVTGPLVECEPVESGLIVADVIGLEPVLDSEFFDTRRSTEKGVDGLSPIPGTYTALGGAVTVSPDTDCLSIVSWGVAVNLLPNTGGHYTIKGTAYASLLLDGVPVGLEISSGFTGRLDDSTGLTPKIEGSLSAQTIVAMSGGQDFELAIGVKASFDAGYAEVPALKASGLSYAFFGG